MIDTFPHSALHCSTMLDFASYRRRAIRYWEIRRLAYNAVLGLASVASYVLAAAVPAAVGDREHFGMGRVVWLFVLSAIGANGCYCLCYAFEFVFGSEDPASRWLQYGRAIVCFAGTSLAVLLACWIGAMIGLAQYRGGVP